jgi:hypothetical protein
MFSDYLLGTDVLGADLVGAAPVAVVGADGADAATAAAAGAHAVSVGQKVSKKLKKIGPKLVAIGNKLNTKAAAAKKASKSAPPAKTSTLVPPRVIVPVAIKSTFIAPSPPTNTSTMAAKSSYSAPAAPTNTAAKTAYTAPAAPAPVKTSARTAPAPVAAPVATKTKGTRVRGEDVPPPPARGRAGAILDSGALSEATDAVVATVQELEATYALSSMADALMPLPDLLYTLQNVSPSMAEAGQSIVDRGNTVTDNYATADFATTTSQANNVSAQANKFQTNAQSILSQSTNAAAVAAAAALAPSGGGGGGGGDDPFGEGSPEGGGGDGGEDPFADQSQEDAAMTAAMDADGNIPQHSDEGAVSSLVEQLQDEEGSTYSSLDEGGGTDGATDDGLPTEVTPEEEPAAEAATESEPDAVVGKSEAPKVVAPEPPFTLKSELPGVSDKAWTKFACAMKTAPTGAVSKSNEIGMYAMKPRRLADLDLVMNIETTRSPDGRMVWVGDFVPPMTAAKFLRDPRAQYDAFAKSMRQYLDGMKRGTISTPEGGRPKEMSLSGALGVLHRAGPNGMKKWNDESSRFEDTKKLFALVNGIF